MAFRIVKAHSKKIKTKSGGTRTVHVKASKPKAYTPKRKK